MVVSYAGIDLVNKPADKFDQYLRSRAGSWCDAARLEDRCLHISQGEILLSQFTVPHIEPNCLTQFVSTFQHYPGTMSTTSVSLVLGQVKNIQQMT